MPRYIHVDVPELIFFFFYHLDNFITKHSTRPLSSLALSIFIPAFIDFLFFISNHHTIPPNMSERIASVERTTSETHISCTIDLDHIPGVTEQKINVSTGIGFLDHVRAAPLFFFSLFLGVQANRETDPDVYSARKARRHVSPTAVQGRPSH